VKIGKHTVAVAAVIQHDSDTFFTIFLLWNVDGIKEELLVRLIVISMMTLQ